MREARKQGPGARGQGPLTFTDQKSKESRVMIRTKQGAKFSLIQSQSKYETMATTRKNRWKKEARGCLKSDAQGLQMVKSLRNVRKRQELSCAANLQAVISSDDVCKHKIMCDISEKNLLNLLDSITEHDWSCKVIFSFKLHIITSSKNIKNLKKNLLAG